MELSVPAPMLLSQPVAAVAQVAPCFGNTPPSIALKQMLGVHAPSLGQATAVAEATVAAMPPRFGEGTSARY